MTQDTITPTTPSAPVDVADLRAKITEQEAVAQAALTEAQAAVDAKDIRGMIAASDKAKQAEANVARLTKQIDRAEYDTRKVERENLVEQFVANVPGLFAQVDVANVRSLQITGLVVSFNEDGTVTCTVNTKAKDAGVKTDIGKGSKGKIDWLYNGMSYKSSDLIEQFGDENFPMPEKDNPKGLGAGAYAIDKAKNPQDYNLKYSPGFNAFVTKLAEKIGAVKVTSAA